MTTFNLFLKLSKFIPSGDLLSDCKIYVLYLIEINVWLSIYLEKSLQLVLT